MGKINCSKQKQANLNSQPAECYESDNDWMSGR